MFFRVMVVDGTLEKVKYHKIRVEFHFRNSPHRRFFFCIINAPKLST